MTWLKEWHQFAITIVSFLISVAIMYERLKAAVKRMEERHQAYIDADRERLSACQNGNTAWKARHESENKNAFDRMDVKINRLFSLIQAGDGRPLYAYREEVEALKRVVQDGQKNIMTEMNSRFDRVMGMIEKYFEQMSAFVKK